MIQRLKEIRLGLGHTQTEFAKFLGITQTAYSMIENGKRPLAEKYIKTICATFNINENWLYTGEGSKYLSSPYEQEFITIFHHLTPDTQTYLLHMAQELLALQEKLLQKPPAP